MELRVSRCTSGGGTVGVDEAPRLSYAVVGLVAAAAAGGGSVFNAPIRSTCFREVARGLTLLGFNVEFSGSSVIVRGEEAVEGGVLDARCRLVTVALLAPLAAVQLPPGKRLVFRVDPFLASDPLKQVVDVVAMLGGRMWRSGRGSMLIVEGSLQRARPLLRLYNPWGALAAGVLLAAARAGSTSVTVHGSVRDSSWLDVLASLDIVPAHSLLGPLQPHFPGESLEVRVEGSVYTVLAASLPLLLCPGSWRAEVRGVSSSIIEEVRSEAAAMGFTAGYTCSGSVCTLVLEPGSPRSRIAAVRASDGSDKLMALLMHAGLSGGVVSGVSLFELEGFRLDLLPHRISGVSIVDDRVEVSPAADSKLSKCEPHLLPACLVSMGVMLRKGHGEMRGVELVNDRFPGLLELMPRLSDAVDVG